MGCYHVALSKEMPCCHQESGLEVALQLLGMRTEEVAQRLLPILTSAAEALQRTSQQLAAWLAVQREASAATKKAQAAHAEAARLQVPYLLSVGSTCAVK